MSKLLILLLSLILMNCAKNEKPEFENYQSSYPRGSGVAISEILERDAINSLKVFLKQKYGNDSFEIVSRSPIGKMKNFIVNEKGRLVAGELNEVWVIKQNKEFHQLEFIMYSDGNFGNYCGFKEN